MYKNRNGFTLIELLVVIAIIGLLASIVLVALSSARAKARDAQRIATLQQIQNALELYNSNVGHYPNTNGTWTAFDPTNGYFNNPIVSPNAVNISAALGPYINGASLIDPSGPTGSGASGYLYDSNGTDYFVMAWLTPENMNDFPSSAVDFNHCGTISNGQCSLKNNVGFWTSANAPGL
jgi:prepilin-type N-terminal cleavage/methylation domain-containing protein